MFKCLECGHIFEDGEQAVWEERHGLESPPYEQFSGCPLCRGEYEQTKPCKHCGSEHTEDELYEGWCEECLREQITYKTFFDYCEADKEGQWLDSFVMSEILGCEYIPKYSSYAFHEAMVKMYWDRVEQIERERETRGVATSEIIDSCVRYVMDCNGAIGRDDFAEWLNKRR